MVQKVSTTFLDETGTIENTSYNTETKTYTTTSESLYNTLVIPNNVIFSVDHPITVLGNLVVSNGSIINGNKKITVLETLVIEKKGTFVTSGDNITFNNLIIDGKMEVNGKFTTENNPLVTVKGELKINGTFGTIQEGNFTLKSGGVLNVNNLDEEGKPKSETLFEDNRRATFTIEDDTDYIVNDVKIVEKVNGGVSKIFSFKEDWSWDNIPLGKMNLSNSSLVGSFKHSNMRECNFVSSEMENVDFSNADLSFANLRECNMKNVKLIGANLKNADLSDADLSGVDLSGADLTNAIINQNTVLNYVNFKKTITGPLDMNGLQNIPEYEDQNLKSNSNDPLYAIFQPFILGAHVNASGVNLQNVELHTSRISTLDGIIFDNANLSGADLVGADNSVSYENASMKNANLTGANLKNLDMTTIDITGANMTDAIVDGVNISGRDLTNTILTGDLKGLKSGNNNKDGFGTPILSSKHALINGHIVGENVDLAGANLKTADLTDISLKGAILANVDMSEATLTNLKSGLTFVGNTLLPSGYISFPMWTESGTVKGGNIIGPGVDLTDTYFEKYPSTANSGNTSNFNGVDFSETNLTGVTFDNVDLTNAKFKDAIFKNVHIKNTMLSNADLTETTIIGLKTTGVLGTPNLPGDYILISFGQDEERIIGPYVNLASDFSFSVADRQLVLSQLNMNYSNFEGASFIGQYIEEGEIQKTDFTRSSLVQSNLKNTTFRYVNFTETDLSLVDFSGANLEYVDFIFANLSGADLSNVSNFKNIKSEGLIFDENTKMPPGCRIENGIFVGPNMNLINADLRSADLSELSFEDSDLSGAIIQGANLSKADFRKVKSLYKVTTGLHPYDESVGNVVDGTQLPFDDPFSPLLPITEESFKVIVHKDGHAYVDDKGKPYGEDPLSEKYPVYNQQESYKGTYAFALGYIFGPNLILIGEDLAWRKDRIGGLIRQTGDPKEITESESRAALAVQAERARTAANNAEKIGSANLAFLVRKAEKAEAAAAASAETQEALAAGELPGAIAVETTNLPRRDDRGRITFHGMDFELPTWFGNVQSWIKRFRYIKEKTEPGKVDDERDAIFTKAGNTNMTPFIIAGISLENTIFKVDDIFNVYFVCDMKNADLSQLGNAGIRESDLFAGSLHMDTVLLQKGYVVYGDRIFGPKMDLSGLRVDGREYPGGSLAGIDWSGSILDGMSLKNIDISRSNIDECDFSNVTMDFVKAFYMSGEPKKRNKDNHKLSYNEDTKESKITLGEIIDGSGLPGGVTLRNEMFVGKRFDFSNETIYGDRNAQINFKDIDFQDSRFSGSQIAFVDFTGATLTGCQFINSRCRWITMRGCDVTSANLSNVIIRHSDLTKANFQYSILRSGEYWDTCFDSDSVFNSADLQGSDFSYTSFNERFTRGDSHWEAVSFATNYDFANIFKLNESWDKKNQNKINVANSYWIAGQIRSYRREFDNVGVFDMGQGDIDIEGAGRYATIPRYVVDGRPIYPYGLIIGADAGISFELAAEYVGSYSLINVVLSPLEAFGPDYIARYVPPDNESVQNRHRINYLPTRSGNKVKNEFLPGGTQGDFEDVWGGWEYDNHTLGAECADDCFHYPKVDNYHIAKEIPFPVRGSIEDRGSRHFFHEQEGAKYYSYKSSYGRLRAINREPRAGPKREAPRLVEYS